MTCDYVGFVILQDSGIVQPMVTVCPNFVDFASLAINFFNSDLYTRDETFEAEINTAVRQTLSSKKKYFLRFLPPICRSIDFQKRVSTSILDEHIATP